MLEKSDLSKNKSTSQFDTSKASIPIPLFGSFFVIYRLSLCRQHKRANCYLRHIQQTLCKHCYIERYYSGTATNTKPYANNS